MNWQLKSFQQLSNKELYNILKERVNIFVVEQNCPYPELDDLDFESQHLFLEESNEIIAYCRILPKGLKYDYVSIGRVIVKKEHRHKKIASKMMEKAIETINKQLNEIEIQLQAQNHLCRFYGSFGFESISDVYLEDGIPHVDMLKKA